VPAADEVRRWRWCATSAIDALIVTQSARFTAWFPLAWPHVKHSLQVGVLSPANSLAANADAEVTVPSSMRARLRSISKSISHAQID
jgi:hypothetical protein